MCQVSTVRGPAADRQRRAFAQVFYGVSTKIDEAALARHSDDVRQQHEGMGLEVE